MWGVLEKASDHVSKFASIFGQMWYLLVFVFRLIVVATIGGAVYGDEQVTNAYYNLILKDVRTLVHIVQRLSLPY